jgi:hypothetical protein
MHKTLNKTIEYGIYLLIFLLPLQTRWIIRAGEFNGGYVEYWTYSLYGFDILLLILVLLQALSTIISPAEKRIKIPMLWFLLGVFELICFVSIFFAHDIGLAVFSYSRLLMGLALFWLIVRAEYNKEKAILSLVGAGLLQSILAIWQFMAQSSFSNKWLGMALHDPAELGVSVIEAISANGYDGRWLRAYGSLDHPNMLGGFLAFAIFMIIVLQFKNSLTNKSHIFLAISFPVIGLALVLSFSRASWIGLIIGLSLMAIIAIKRRALIIQKIIAQSIFIIALVFFAMYLIYPNLFTARINTNTRLEKISKQERISAIESAQRISSNYGQLGIGNYTQGLIRIQNYKNFYELQPVHNTFLLIRSELGIFGILIFIVILLYFLQIVIKSKERIYIIGILMLILSIFMFDHWLWSLHFGLILLAFDGRD